VFGVADSSYLVIEFLVLMCPAFMNVNIGCCCLLGYRHALNVQIFLKMHRSDYADKQLKIMQQTDEDHTLTQLANAWLDIAVVSNFTCSVV
jgi:hypothetical protein